MKAPKSITSGPFQAEPDVDVPIEIGGLYIADNGMPVMISAEPTMVADHVSAWRLTIVKGKSFFVRHFPEAPKTRNWRARKINAFAKFVKETKLRRGPRARTNAGA